MDHIALFGLGNIGDEYRFTRHNAGFLILDYIAKSNHIPFERIKKIHGYTADIITHNTKISLIKPTTFMNESGICVKQFVQYYKLNISNILILHDEVDLALGKIKPKIGGSDAGNKGVKSINQHIKKQYLRIRIGIDKEKNQQGLSNYVLSKFSPLQLPIIYKIAHHINENLFQIASNLNIEYLHQLTTKINQSVAKQY